MIVLTPGSSNCPEMPVARAMLPENVEQLERPVASAPELRVLVPETEQPLSAAESKGRC